VPIPSACNTAISPTSDRSEFPSNGPNIPFSYRTLALPAHPTPKYIHHQNFEHLCCCVRPLISICHFPGSVVNSQFRLPHHSINIITSLTLRMDGASAIRFVNHTQPSPLCAKLDFSMPYAASFQSICFPFLCIGLFFSSSFLEGRGGLECKAFLCLLARLRIS
jgi:hypothetical protein